MDRWTCRALAAWCTAVVAFGSGLSGAAFASTDGFARLAFALLGKSAVAFTPELRFAVALMGAVTVGWGLTIGAAVAGSATLGRAEAQALWRRMATAVCVWFVLDSTLSVATGFAPNAGSNTVLMVAFVAILWHGGLLASSGPVRPLSREGGMG